MNYKNMLNKSRVKIRFNTSKMKNINQTNKNIIIVAKLKKINSKIIVKLAKLIYKKTKSAINKFILLYLLKIVINNIMI